MGFISYAQNNEDVLLHRVFGGQETGFYVDVGAYHPVEGSVTKALYDRGWSGINLEPGAIFEELAAARPRDVNLRIAVTDSQGTVSFAEDPADAGMSRVVDGGSAGVVKSVPCDTLENIVRQYGRGRPVDIIKIDAEGAEQSIICSTDWRRLRPRVLVVESTLPWSTTLSNEEWERALLEQDYVRAYFDGINCFYIPQEEVPVLMRHFLAPVCVLDGVIPYSTVQIQADRDRKVQELIAARDELEGERADRAREGDLLNAKLEQAYEAQNRAISERNQIAIERDQLIFDRGQMEVERDQLIFDRGQMEVERDQISRALAELQSSLMTQAEPVQPAASVVEPPRNPSVARRASRLAYRVVRPVVRPIAWRLRGFLLGDLNARLDTMQSRLQVPPASQFVQTTAPSAADLDLLHQRILADVANVTAAPLAEMRRIAGVIESAVLTLALEAAATPRASGSVLDDAPVAGSVEVPLRLPRGRSAKLFGRAGDLSVAAALAGTDGIWEPHVQRFFEASVDADSVCMDIGANIGAHTLGLAVLADRGHVIAFEADPANYDLLQRNSVRLDPPKGRVEPVHVALWDSPGSLVIGGADELAGCSFVSDKPADAAATEEKLRSVVDGGAIAETELHLRMATVNAMRLDDWIADRPLARLDLIKLDVEGAEAYVLKGAKDTIRRFQPKLLVEYNPPCAENYFGQARDALYHELASQFPFIALLEDDGTLTSLPDWETLSSRLESGRGWEDLVCSHSKLV